MPDPTPSHRRRSTGPRRHAVSQTVPERWTCSCGLATGLTEEDMDRHQSRAAKAALRRQTDLQAWATAVTSVSSDTTRHALRLLDPHRVFGKVRRYLIGGYDHFGCLTAVMNWVLAGQAADQGVFHDPDDPEPELLIRAAVALALGDYPIRLADLADLGKDARRLVREAVLDLYLNDE